MGLLESKVALVTGGARGQGRAHALACAREGADVVIVDITEQVSNVRYPLASADDHAETVRLVEGLGRRAIAVVGDVRDQTALDGAVSRAVDTFGHLDILIANAGIWETTPFWQLTEQQWDETIATNLTGVWMSAKAVAPHMIERQTGSIVLIASVNGLEAGPNHAHYTAAKHGVLGLMKTVALELGPHGIRCNAVCPGPVDTIMVGNQHALDAYAGRPGGTRADMVEAGSHFGILRGSSFLDPRRIADAALFLNSDLAANVTGITIPVESGHLLIPGVNTAPVRPDIDTGDSPRRLGVVTVEPTPAIGRQ